MDTLQKNAGCFFRDPIFFLYYPALLRLFLNCIGDISNR